MYRRCHVEQRLLYKWGCSRIVRITATSKFLDVISASGVRRNMSVRKLGVREGGCAGNVQLEKAHWGETENVLHERNDREQFEQGTAEVISHVSVSWLDCRIKLTTSAFRKFVCFAAAVGRLRLIFFASRKDHCRHVCSVCPFVFTVESCWSMI